VAILKGLYGSAANITILHEGIIAPEVSGKYRISKTLFPVKIEDYLEENPLNTQR
jgi:hypothetical protein